MGDIIGDIIKNIDNLQMGGVCKMVNSCNICVDDDSIIHVKCEDMDIMEMIIESADPVMELALQIVSLATGKLGPEIEFYMTIIKILVLMGMFGLSFVYLFLLPTFTREKKSFILFDIILAIVVIIIMSFKIITGRKVTNVNKCENILSKFLK